MLEKRFLKDWIVVTGAFILNGSTFGIWASRIPAFVVRFELSPAALGGFLFLVTNETPFYVFSVLAFIAACGIYYKLEPSNIIKKEIYNHTSDLLSLDLKKIKEILEQEQWIKRVNLKKVYPSTLVLDIIENDPYAILRDKGKYYLVDIDGTIITE